MAYFPNKPIKIPDTDRIINRLPVSDESDQTTLNANRVMHLFDKVVSGLTRSSLRVWSYTSIDDTVSMTNKRPAVADTPSVRPGEYGYNTDFNGIEVYTGGSYGWLVLQGVWSLSTRPHESSVGSNDLAPGSQGFNTDSLQREYWDGSEWKAV